MENKLLISSAPNQLIIIEDDLYKISKFYLQFLRNKNLKHNEIKKLLLNHKDTVLLEMKISKSFEMKIDNSLYKINKEFFDSIDKKLPIEERKNLILNHPETTIRIKQYSR